METIEGPRALSRERRIEGWYEELFPTVCSYIQKRGGELDNAKELFQEALVIYYEKHAKTGFLPEKVEEAYIMGIIKKLWLRMNSDKKEMTSIQDLELEEPEKPVELQTKKLLMFLEATGRKCMELLQSFYYDGLNMKEMSERHGYGSERSVTVQKYKCLEKVRNEVKQRALGYEDFLS